MISSFSPITPVCSISFSATVIPPKSAARKDSLSLQFKAMSANSPPSATKDSFFPTKSVSQARTMATPAVLSSLTLVTATPSVDALSALFAAIFCPFLRKISTALSKSPCASTNAFLQSIIPAPVASLNFFTSAALIFTVSMFDFR